MMAFASTLSAQNASTEIGIGNSKYEEGDYAGAEVYYLRALQKDPESVIAAYNLGNAFLKQGKFEAAASQYAAAANLTEDKDRLASIYHNQGNAYYGNKQFDKSIESYKKALKINPNDEDTRYNLVMAQMQLQQLQQQQNQQQKQQQEQQQQQDQPQDPEEISKENAQQILDAYMEDDRETKAKMQQQSGQGSFDTDW